MLRVLLTIGALQGLTMLVNVLRTKALAVLLGPEWIGLMAVVDKLLGVLAQTASLSLPYATIRFLPSLLSQDPVEFAALLRRMRNLLVLMILGSTLLGLVVTLEFPQAWGEELLPYQSIVLIAFFTLPVVALVPFLQNAIAARMQHHASMLFSLAHGVVLTLTGILGAWWSGLAGLYGLYAALGLLLVIPVIRSIERPPQGDNSAVLGRRRFAIGLPRQIWRFSLALLGLTFLTPFAAVYVHYRVLSHFGLRAAGWMQAAMGLAFSVRAVLGASGAVFLTPNVNRGGPPGERMRWVVEYYNTLSVLCGLVGCGLLMFPHQALSILYSNEFSAAVPFVTLFVIAEVIGLLAGTLQSLVVAFDHITYHVAQNTAAQGLLLVVAFLLIEDWGIWGAAAAGICAPLFLYVSTTLFLRRKYALSLPARSMLLGGFVTSSLGLAGIIGVAFSEVSLGVVAAKLLLYGGFVVGLGLLLGQAERAKFWSFVRAIRGRVYSLREGVRVERM